MNSQMPQPRFNHTGLWLPVQLKNLPIPRESHTLLATIQALDSGDPEYCFATNNYLANEVGLSESRVSFYITLFKRLNLIEEVSFNGRIRRLKCLTHNWYLYPNSKKESCVSTRTLKKSKKEVCKNSKKESCVPTRSLPTCQRVGCLRANAQSIDNIIDNTKENISTLPPDPPPLESPSPQEPSEEKASTPQSSIGGGQVSKSLSSESIVYFNAKGSRQKVLLSDIWRYFITKPYETATVQRAIEELAGNCSHIRDIFCYLEKICRRIVQENTRKSSSKELRKVRDEESKLPSENVDTEEVTSKEPLKTVNLGDFFKQHEKTAGNNANTLHIPKCPPG